MAVRGLGETLGLTEMASVMIKDKRTERNVKHELTGLLKHTFATPSQETPIYASMQVLERVNADGYDVHADMASEPKE